MSDPLAVAVVGFVTAVIGGLVGGAIRPWGEDWVSRRREDRDAQRARQSRRRDQLERAADMLLMAPRDGAARAALPPVIAEIGDPALRSHVEQMLSAGASTSAPFTTARTDAQTRVGELLRET
ncbi:MAG: hypothetical protein ACYDB6_02890 [Candidatus Limnocylindrales bacterium]